MIKDSKLFLLKSGIAIGLLIGTLDSAIHFANFESYKILNIILFILFFAGVYWSILHLRNKIEDKIISFGAAFKHYVITGLIAAFVISLIRFLFLKLTGSIELNEVLNYTKGIMLTEPGLYSQDEISNRLAFIEFTYNPVISSILYFAYYSIFVVLFALIASAFLKRVDRNISLY